MEVGHRAVSAHEVLGVSAADFADWVRPHWQVMSRLAQRLVGDLAAEDVLQDALTSAWRSRSKFDPVRGRPQTWLLAIVANQAKNHHRRGRREAAAAETVDEQVAGHELAVSLDLARALVRLTARQRAAVALFYYCGLSVSECAEVLACSAGTVKSTLSDARGHLRSILGDDYQ